MVLHCIHGSPIKKKKRKIDSVGLLSHLLSYCLCIHSISRWYEIVFAFTIFPDVITILTLLLLLQLQAMLSAFIRILFD